MLKNDLYIMLEPTVESLGFELWGLQLITGSKTHVLRLFIEKDDGVGIEDCANVSRQVGAILDVEDPISADYTLEVSSPGMDRLLFKEAHYSAYIGQKLKVKLAIPFEGRKKFTGQLMGLEDQEIILHMDSEEYILPIESIDKAQVLT